MPPNKSLFRELSYGFDFIITTVSKLVITANKSTVIKRGILTAKPPTYST